MKLVASVLCVALLLDGLQVTAAPTLSVKASKKYNKKLIVGITATAIAITLLMKHHNHRKWGSFFDPTVRAAPSTGGSTTGGGTTGGSTNAGSGGVVTSNTVTLFFEGWGYPVGNQEGICLSNDPKFCNGINNGRFLRALKASDTTGEWTKLFGLDAEMIVGYPYNNSGKSIVMKSNITNQQADALIDILKRTAPLGAIFKFKKI